jgi:3-hydroxyisobutyrate dehydrogenase-like beta-hydroxyacid dehydrogenase
MGGPMAERLLDAGYRLCIYDKQPAATPPSRVLPGPAGLRPGSDHGGKPSEGRRAAASSFLLLDAGYRLCIYDKQPAATAALAARGARVAASPGE